MKKSLLALAVLGTFAGAASAQSSVTLFGTVDLNARYVKNDGSSRRVSLSQDGINSSQLGFRGVEDLGGGLKASFILLAGVNADTGTTNTKFFNRRSTASLSGGFGEIRLGRDYVPTFWNNTNFDAFGTNGLGDSSHVQQLGTATFVRADNSIGYFLPENLGGAYGQLMAAAGEGGGNGGTATNPGRYLGGRLGFAAGPFDVAIAAAQQRFVGTAGNLNPVGGTGSQKTYNVGGSYDLRFVKILAYFDYDKVPGFNEKRGSISAVVPLGQGEIHVGYDRSKLSGSARTLGLLSTATSNTVDQAALTYQYNLSKRTAFYGTVAYLRNGDGNDSNGAAAGGFATNSVAGGSVNGAITALPTRSGNSKGAEFGVRHFF